MLKWIINLLFPPKCIFCSKILDVNKDVFICNDCLGRVPFMEGSSIKLKSGINYYDDVICVCEYTGIIKEALLRFKFSNKPSYHITFARLLLDRINKVYDIGMFDMIISVPLHPLKESTRGYNQSYLISGALSRKTGIKEESGLISRIRDTGSQSLLTRSERLTNVKDAFKVNETSKVEGKAILLVDDVMTTGSTLNECSKTLKQAGAKKVVVAVIASGRKF